MTKKIGGFGILLLLLSSCQKQPPSHANCPNWNAPSLTYAAKLSVEAAQSATTSEERVRNAKKGIIWSERCIESFPNEAECYHYRDLAKELRSAKIKKDSDQK